MLSFYLSTIESPADQEKCTQLYNRYKRIMLKVAYSILKDYHMANDAVHESFMKIIKVLDRIDDVESTRTKNYLITIVQNDALKMYNKRRNSNEDLLEILTDDFQSDLDLEFACLSAASVEFIKEKVKDLQDIHTDILLLKLFNNLSYEQIAQALDISQATARKRYERAKLALIVQLKKGDVYDLRWGRD